MRLKSLHSKLSPSTRAKLTPRSIPGDEHWRDRERAEHQPWRRWYKLARWRRLAERVFLRDSYTCQKTGIVLGFRAPHPHSPVAHHKRPHRGDPTLFWDEANVECVSKEWHDGEGQRSEKRSA
jgi:5-methylcytosine-specific restriction protein A